MSRTFVVPVVDDQPPSLVFPGRCLSCGAPPDAESALVITRLVVKHGAQVPITFRYQIPHCARCARATKTVFLAGLIPFLFGFAGAGLVTFLSVAIWTSPLDDPTSRTTPSLVLGAAAALAAGLVAGFVAEILARLVLWPLFGWSLLNGTAPGAAAPAGLGSRGRGDGETEKRSVGVAPDVPARDGRAGIFWPEFG